MKERIVDEQIRLVPYYRNDAVSLRWYQDAAVCKQVDNRDTPYDLALLHRMYDYLCSHGDCYYIEYLGILVGDVSLLDSGEVAIVVCKEYQNQHIGRRCLLNILKLATVYKGNIIKNLIMDCQSYTKYRPNETTGGIFVSWRRKEELPTGA